jgi:hypothetical protein
MPPQVRATNTLPPDGKDAESCDLLHVPTPWHGCVVEIAGDGHIYLAKVEQVKEAIQEEKVLAAWVEPAVEETDVVVQSKGGKVGGSKSSGGSRSSSDAGLSSESDGGSSSDTGSTETTATEPGTMEKAAKETKVDDACPTAAHFTLIPTEKMYRV